MVLGACEGVGGGNNSNKRRQWTSTVIWIANLLNTGETLKAAALLLIPRKIYDWRTIIHNG